MNEYEQILQKAKEQGLDFDGKDIIIPITENKLMLNGEIYFGRVFDHIIYVLKDVEEPFVEKGFCSEPFLYLIIDRYQTWITGGSIAYNVEFYIVE
jgi:hypothetical protein